MASRWDRIVPAWPKVAALSLSLTACGTGTIYTGVSTGPPRRAVDCAVDAVTDEGFSIRSRNDDNGTLVAVYGSDMIERRMVGGGPRNTFRLEVRSSDSDVAREAAAEIIAECGAG